MTGQVKLFFCDTETTGLEPERHGITQIAGEIGYLSAEGGYESKTAFNFHVAPFGQDVIEARALEAQKVSRQEVEAYPLPSVIFPKLMKIISRHIDKYEPTDKLWFVAYNSPFDNAFLREFWRKMGDKYFGSLFWTPDLCVMRMAAHELRYARDEMPNFKLSTVAERLQVTVDPATLHDASTDIALTREIYLKLVTKP